MIEIIKKSTHMRSRRRWPSGHSASVALVVLLAESCGGTDGSGVAVGGAGASFAGQSQSDAGFGGDREANGGETEVTDGLGGAGAAGAAETTGMAGQGGDDGGSAGTAGTSGVIDDSANNAVAYRIDTAHTGAQLSQKLEPPFDRLWTKAFDSAVSYPLIVGKRVFVTALGSSVTPASKRSPAVFGFDRDSGAQLWESEAVVSKFSTPVHLAYDNGLVFASNEDGQVLAVKAETGATAWSVKLAEIYGFGTMPIASGGSVYLTGATNDYLDLFALDERDGSVRFRVKAQGQGPVTLGDSRLFTSSGCHETSAADLANGEPLWHYVESCTGGGQPVTVYHDDRLFVSDSGSSTVELDAASGKLVSSIDASGIGPLAVVSDQALLASQRVRGGELTSFDLQSGAKRWSLRLDDSPVLPIVSTPGYALLATRTALNDTYLQAVDLAQRKIVWTSTEPVAKATSDASSGLDPVQGVAAGQGRIAVAVQRSLTVFAPAR